MTRRADCRGSRSSCPAALTCSSDDYLIERTRALTRTAHQARRLPQPVLESGPGHPAHASAVLPQGVPRSRQPRRAVPDVVRRRLHRLRAPQLRLRRVGRRPHLALPGTGHRRDRRVAGQQRRAPGRLLHVPGRPCPVRERGMRRPGAALRAALHRRRPLLRRVLARRIPLDRRPRQPGVPGHREPHGGPAERLLGPAAEPLPGHRRLLRPARRRLHRQAALPPRRLSPPGRPDHQHRPAPLDAVSPDRGLRPRGGGADAGVLRHAAGRARVALRGLPARAARRPAGRSGRSRARHRLDGALHQPRRRALDPAGRRAAGPRPPAGELGPRHGVDGRVRDRRRPRADLLQRLRARPQDGHLGRRPPARRGDPAPRRVRLLRRGRGGARHAAHAAVRLERRAADGQRADPRRAARAPAGRGRAAGARALLPGLPAADRRAPWPRRCAGPARRRRCAAGSCGWSSASATRSCTRSRRSSLYPDRAAAGGPRPCHP